MCHISLFFTEFMTHSSVHPLIPMILFPVPNGAYAVQNHFNVLFSVCYLLQDKKADHFTGYIPCCSLRQLFNYHNAVHLYI